MRDAPIWYEGWGFAETHPRHYLRKVFIRNDLMVDLQHKVLKAG
jgi:hypothetical protein